MNPKGLQTSKLNWLGVVMMTTPVIGPLRKFVMEVVALLPEHYRPLAFSAIGLLICVLRTFFTSRAVTWPWSKKPLATPPSAG